MRVTIALAGLTLALAMVPAASAAGPDTLTLVPDWPASFDEARREPIRLLPGPPLADRAVHAATEPGSRTAGTSHTFHWTLQTPDGSPGPAGPLDLAAGEPVTVDVHLSAGPPSLTPASDLPAGPEAGLAPTVTVEAAVTIAGETSAPQPVTHTLVNTPAGQDVQRYRFAFDVAADSLDPGEELSLDLAVHQLDTGEDQATQPAWRIHTGAQHPSQLTLVLDPVDEGSTGLSLQGVSGDASQESVRQGAYAALAASVLAAGWAARRGYRQLGEG